jgi:diguanylate cyclase (GGDEF)-like protein
MFQLIDLIATLTDRRDRESLDTALAGVLMELLQPARVGIHLLLSDADEQRWLPAVVLEQGGAPVLHDSMHVDFRRLPRVVADSPRARCLEALLPVAVEDAVGTPSCLTCLPLFAGREPGEAGVVEIRSAARLDARALAAIERVLRVYRNMHALFMYSERDALTGLLNRKSFEETFYKSLRDEPVPPAGASVSGGPDEALPQRRLRTGERFWLAMVDVDHFKQVNDQYGHQIGDEVLILVARILKNTFRGYDRVYRFGGEEFVVLLRCPDAVAALQTAERLRLKMEQYRFPQVGRITVSVGLTAIRSGDAPDVVCNRADQAVYHAKRNGRNRVCSYDELVQQGLLQAEVRDGGVELF